MPRISETEHKQQDDMGVNNVKGMYLAAALSVSVLAASCTPPPQDSKPDLATLKKDSHDLTHMLVDKDAIFTNSIKEILPNGVYRESPAEFSKLRIEPKSRSPVQADAFNLGLTTSYEISKMLGTPVLNSKDRSGLFVYSYDATDGSIVTYVFASSGTLEKWYGYHVSVH